MVMKPPVGKDIDPLVDQVRKLLLTRFDVTTITI